MDQGLKLLMIWVGMVVNKNTFLIAMAQMDPMDLQMLLTYFPFPINHINDGLKYLGFHIKQNEYHTKDWDWIIAKIERHINLWIQKWISRVGRLVLIKYVIEAILVYWVALSWIQNGIL